MTKKEEKSFQYLSNGTLKVTIQTQDDLFLPGHNGNILLGIQDQTTIHTIKKDNVPSLKAFMQSQMGIVEADIAKLKGEINKINSLYGTEEKENEEQEKVLKKIDEKLKTNKGWKKNVKAFDAFRRDMLMRRSHKFTLNQKEEAMKTMKGDWEGINNAKNSV